MNKIAATALTIVLLLGGHIFLTTSRPTWAEPSESPMPSATGVPASSSKSAPSETAPNNTFDTSTHPNSDQKAASEESSTSEVPVWLWFILAGLGLWNVALSFLFWQSFKETRLSGHKTAQNLNKLKENDDNLNQRISRKSALIDELKEQLSSYRKTLEVVQLQVQSKSTRADGYGFESQNKPASYGNNEPFVSQDYDYRTRSSNYGQPAPAVSEPWHSIVQTYNASPQALESHIVEWVSESEESVASRRGNSNAAVFLKAANNYSYWIFAGENRSYWLTPKSDLKVTPMGFDTLQALFECPEYQQGSKIQVIKPARVAQNSFSDGWDLVEKGQVQFVR